MDLVSVDLVDLFCGSISDCIGGSFTVDLFPLIVVDYFVNVVHLFCGSTPCGCGGSCLWTVFFLLLVLVYLFFGYGESIL